MRLISKFGSMPLRMAVAVLPAIPALAQEGARDALADMSLQDLMGMDVFVSATLMPTPISKAPGTVYSFTRDDFARYGVRRLDDLLQFVPGMQVNQYRKRHNSLWARGVLDRYNDKMILMVDGVRRQHLYYGHFSLGDNFPLERIERVEVILGPASSLYGANAFAGVISVTTRDFSDQPKLEISMEAGNNERIKTTGLYNSRRVQIFGSYLDQEAPFDEDRKSFIGRDVLQPLDEDYTTLQVKARPLPGLTLSLDYSESEAPFLFIPSDQDAFIEEESLFLSADYKAGDLQSGRLEANLFYHQDDAREYEVEQQTRRLGYEEFQDATMAGITLTGFRAINTHTLAAGFSWRREEAEDTEFERWFHFRDGFLDPTVSGDLLSIPGISNDEYALFAQDVWDIDENLQLTLSGRYDDFEQFDDYFNYRAALVYTHNTHHVWKLMHGTAIRTPGLREYLKVLEGTDFMPPTPDAESIESTELAYVYQGQKHNFSVTLYDNHFEDFISEAPTPDGEDEFFTNSTGKLKLHGAEVLLDLNPSDNLNVRFALSHVDSDLDRSELDELPYVASWSSSFNVNYRWNSDHRVGFSLVHNSPRGDTNSHADDAADDFVIGSFFASGKLLTNLDYSLGVDNLFDRDVQDPAADFGGQYNTEKSVRQVWVRLTWKPVL
ncbi:TonB-dependent receptor [Pseudomaricurvus alkylphenolicus]|uniref:TonB-dependent receptor plug domain-containing protein n=1 Tax=Pseudomaricurvus alkylphenolicus TaxID=1306991 RepID=UPI00141EF1E3|nr:TonB-dependent receptor [Pseudomaricurvus alkylphenolicus]NIB39897.1 TonB-dependent receptor [Pseudomaricurvus alkylphenolicus]